MHFITNAVRTAQKHVDLGGLPVLVIGYSRGGAIAVEYGAVATERKLPAPDWIMSVFPAPYGNQKHLIDLAGVPHFTEMLILVGDQDQVVGTAGARSSGSVSSEGGFPAQNVQIDEVQSARRVHGRPLRPDERIAGREERLLASGRRRPRRARPKRDG